jgi:plasmid stabilization system protein ParE
VSVRASIRRTRTALDDLLSIIDHVIAREGTVAAERLAGRITGEVASLTTMPLRCRVVPELEAEGIDGYRELIVGPYRVVFAVRDSGIIILTVLDGRRDLAELLVSRALRARD